MKISESVLREVVRGIIKEQATDQPSVYARNKLVKLRAKIAELDARVRNSRDPMSPSATKRRLYDLINVYEELGGDMAELRQAGVRGA